MELPIKFRKKIAPKIRKPLRTFEPQIMKKFKNIEPRQKLSGSYKKKSVALLGTKVLLKGMSGKSNQSDSRKQQKFPA